MPATVRLLQPFTCALAPRARRTCASERDSPTLAAARCHACSGAIRGLPASVSSPLMLELVDTTFQPPATFATPSVTRPPPEASRPPNVWRSDTAWPSLPASRESLASSSPLVELSLKRALLRSSHARAASGAAAAAIVLPSALPGFTSEDGVPNWFQETVALSCATSARWALVGLMVPRTWMSGSAREVSIGSGAARATPPGTTIPATTTAKTTRVTRMTISPPRMRTAPPVQAGRARPGIHSSGGRLSSSCPRADLPWHVEVGRSTPTSRPARARRFTVAGLPARGRR